MMVTVLVGLFFLKAVLGDESGVCDCVSDQPGWCSIEGAHVNPSCVYPANLQWDGGATVSDEQLSTCFDKCTQDSECLSFHHRGSCQFCIEDGTAFRVESGITLYKQVDVCDAAIDDAIATTIAATTIAATTDPSSDANCESIPIDAYLTSCSDEFAANELDIESLQSAQTAMTDRLDAAEETITANGEQNAADLDAVEATLQGVESDLAAVKVDISANDERVDEVVSAADAVDETIELLEERMADVEAWKETVITFSSARATPGMTEQGMAVGAYDYGGAMSFANKDILIAVLAVANAVLIIGLLCRECGAQRRAEYAKVYASEN